jgi:hypothetical protein
VDGSWDIEVQPKLIGRYEIEVSLPYRKGTIENPLCASELENYWRKEMNRAGLNSAAIGSVAGSAWDRVFFNNNMSLESHLRETKHRNSRHKRSIGNLPSYMMGRWKDGMETAAYVSNQLKVLPGKIKKRKAKAQRREEDEEMKWQRGSKATTGSLKERWKKMVSILTAAMHQEHGSEDAAAYVFDKKNVMSMYRVLEYVSTKMEGDNLTQDQFYKWHNEERNTMLPDDFDQLIDGMYNKYVSFDIANQSKKQKGGDRNVLKGSERKYKPQQILSKNLETGKYLVQWAPDGSTTHESQSNVADTGVIDIYDWNMDAMSKLERLDRSYPAIVTIRHQYGESMVDLGDEEVHWRRQKIAYGDTVNAQEIPTEGETIYITFKKAGNIEGQCDIMLVHEMKSRSKN